jgi:hypothetical protein
MSLENALTGGLAAACIEINSEQKMNAALSAKAE